MEITEKMLEEKLTQIIGENLKNSLPEIAKAELGAVVEKMKAVHPYEEVAFDIYSLENLYIPND